MTEPLFDEQATLEKVLQGLEGGTQDLFTELVKRLDEKPRKVLLLITNGSVSNDDLAAALDCAPASIVRYRKAIRRKLEEIAGERTH